MSLIPQQCINSDFIKICKEKDLKLTPQRIAIYNAIIDLDTHPSADEVYRIVIQQFSTISFDTVNRTLRTFAEIGIIDIIESSSGVRRFDPDTTRHHHIHCRICGGIIDFESTEYDNLLVPKKIKTEYKIDRVKVTLSGICTACQQAEEIG